ncbi:MAG: helix-turn-helix domain-containing protein [Paenalcaligenes sp.]
MSVEVMTAVFKRYPNGGGEMLLALALADHAHDDGTKVFPFVKSLADKTRQSVRSVQYQLRKMEECGWLILVNAGNGGRGQPNEYRINPDWIKGAEIAPIKRVQSETEKGANDDAKGASDDTKGCNSLHPHITIKEPSVTIIEPSKARKARTEDLELPDWLPVELWEKWDEFRKEVSGKKWTMAAKKLSVDTLGKLLAAGNDITEVVNQSIERGWTGLFAVRDLQPVATSGGKFNPAEAMRQRDAGRNGWKGAGDVIDV